MIVVEQLPAHQYDPCTASETHRGNIKPAPERAEATICRTPPGPALRGGGGGGAPRSPQPGAGPPPGGQAALLSLPPPPPVLGPGQARQPAGHPRGAAERGRGGALRWAHSPGWAAAPPRPPPPAGRRGCAARWRHELAPARLLRAVWRDCWDAVA